MSQSSRRSTEEVYLAGLRRGLRLLSSASIVALLVFTSPPRVRANGFFVPMQSVQAIGRAQAGGVCMASDPSTIFFNPAGMTELWSPRWFRQPTPPSGGDTLGALGVHVINPTISFRNTGTTATTLGTGGLVLPLAGNNGGDPVSLTTVPNFYVAHRLKSKNVYLGLGITAPFGLSEEYDRDWFGRYDLIAGELLTLNVAPTIAVRVNNKFSIGGGIDLQLIDAELSNAVPNPFVPGGPTSATDGHSLLKGSDESFGFNIGLLFKPQPSTRIGLHYRSAMKHSLTGTAEVSRLAGPLAAFNGTVGATVDLELPQIASLGVAQEFGKLTLLGEASWYGWSSFDEIRVQLASGAPDQVREAGWRDTYTVSAGAEYRLSDSFDFRGGLSYDRTPTVDDLRDTLVPDADRVWLSVGATWRTGLKWATAFDIAATHVIFDDGVVDLTRSFFEGTPVAANINIEGVAKTKTTTLSFGWRLRFN